MLAQQLEAHRSRTGNATGATQTKWRPSVLMDPREAADLDIATVRDVAVNGFAELVMLAPALSDFEAPLFGSSLSASTERHMLDPAAANALQNALNRFLAMASPFLQHRCALKVIDFLLRRHHVHVHNADALMLSVLPYHETELFVKVMRLPVSIAGTKWAALQDVQRARKTITRKMVAKVMMGQPGLIKTFLEHVDAICGFYSLPGSGTSHVPGFFAAAFTQLISQAPSSWVEGKLAHVLVPRLTQGVTAFDCAPRLSFSCVVLVALARRFTFTDNASVKLLESLMTNIRLDASEDLILMAVQAFAVVCELQVLGGVKKSTTSSTVVTAIAPGVTTDVTAIMPAELIEAVVAKFAFRPDVLAGALDKLPESSRFLLCLMTSLLEEGFRTRDDLAIRSLELASSLFTCLQSAKSLVLPLASYILTQADKATDCVDSSQVHELMRELAALNPDAMDSAIEAALRNRNSESSKPSGLGPKAKARAAKAAAAASTLLRESYDEYPSFIRHLPFGETVSDVTKPKNNRTKDKQTGNGTISNEPSASNTTLFLAMHSPHSHVRQRALADLTASLNSEDQVDGGLLDSLVSGSLSFCVSTAIQMSSGNGPKSATVGLTFLHKLLTLWSTEQQPSTSEESARCLRGVVEAIVSQHVHVSRSPSAESVSALRIALACVEILPVSQVLEVGVCGPTAAVALTRFVVSLVFSPVENKTSEPSEEALTAEALKALCSLGTQDPVNFALFATAIKKKASTPTLPTNIQELAKQVVVPALMEDVETLVPVLLALPFIVAESKGGEMATQEINRLALVAHCLLALDMKNSRDKNVVATNDAVLSHLLNVCGALVQGTTTMSQLIETCLEHVVAYIASDSVCQQRRLERTSQLLAVVYVSPVNAFPTLLASTLKTLVTSPSLSQVLPGALAAICAGSLRVSTLTSKSTSQTTVQDGEQPQQVTESTSGPSALVVQRALHTTLLLIKAQGEMTADHSALVPVLLLNLTNDSSDVRSAALKCLAAVQQSADGVAYSTNELPAPLFPGVNAQGLADLSAPFNQLAKAMLDRSDDAAVDCECVRRVVTTRVTPTSNSKTAVSAAQSVLGALFSFAGELIRSDFSAQELPRALGIEQTLVHSFAASSLVELCLSNVNGSIALNCPPEFENLVATICYRASDVNDFTFQSAFKTLLRCVVNSLSQAQITLTVPVAQCVLTGLHGGSVDGILEIGSQPLASNDMAGCARFVRSLALTLVTRDHFATVVKEHDIVASQLFSVLLQLACASSNDNTSSRAVQAFRKLNMSGLARRELLALAGGNVEVNEEVLLATPTAGSNAWLARVIVVAEAYTESATADEISQSVSKDTQIQETDAELDNVKALLRVVARLLELRASARGDVEMNEEVEGAVKPRRFGRARSSSVSSLVGAMDEGRAAYALGLLLGVAARCVGRATALASVNGVSLSDKLAGDQDAAVELGLAVAVQAVVQAPDSHARNAGLSLLPQLAGLFPIQILEQIAPIFEHICDVEATAWSDAELVAVLRQVTRTISVVANASTSTVSKKSKNKKGSGTQQARDSTMANVLVQFDSALASARGATLTRKLELYTVLVEALDNDAGALWGVTALVLARGIGNKSHTDSGAAGDSEGLRSLGPDLKTFGRALFARFSPHQQIAACSALTEKVAYLASGSATLESPGTKDVASSGPQAYQASRVLDSCIALATSNCADGDLEGMSTKRRELALGVSELIGRHIGSRSFAKQLVSMSLQDSETYAKEQSEMDVGNEVLDGSDRMPDGMKGFLALLQHTIREMRVSGQEASIAADAGDIPAHAQWNKLRVSLEEVLDRVTALLSVPMFVAVVTELIQDESAAVRHIALRQMGLKVKEQHDKWSRNEDLLFLDMVGDLQVILEDKQESDMNKQTALLSLDILATYLAPRHPKPFVPLATAVVVLLRDRAKNKTFATMSASEFELYSSLCLCVGTMVRALGPLLLAQFPIYTPLILAGCEQLLDAEDDESVDGEEQEDGGAAADALLLRSRRLLAESSGAALLSVLQAVPSFFTPFISRIVMYLARVHAMENTSEANTILVKQLSQKLVEGLESRVLLPNLFSAVSQLISDNEDVEACSYALELVQEALSRVDADGVEDLLPSISNFFESALGFRGQILGLADSELLEDESEYDEEEREAVEAGAKLVEDGICEALRGFVMLLRERQLRPLFSQLCRAVSSATSPDGTSTHDVVDPLLVVGTKRGRKESIEMESNDESTRVVTAKMLMQQARAATLYVVIDGLLDRLMGIFAAMVEGEVLAVLARELAVEFRDVGGAPVETTKKSKTKKQRLVVEDADSSRDVAVVEWNRQQLVIKSRVLECITAFSKHRGTLPREVFDVVLAPVVDQLDLSNAVPGGKNATDAHLAIYKSTTGDLVIPCIVQIAQSCRMCTEGTVLWQTLHHRVLKLMRNSVAGVRLVAVHAVRALFEEMGDEYLALLADTLPSLAELLEDSAADVRRHAQILARLLRDLSGEDIDSFLR